MAKRTDGRTDERMGGYDGFITRFLFGICFRDGKVPVEIFLEIRYEEKEDLTNGNQRVKKTIVKKTLSTYEVH